MATVGIKGLIVSSCSSDGGICTHSQMLVIIIGQRRRGV